MDGIQTSCLAEKGNRPRSDTFPASHYPSHCDGYFAADSPQHFLGIALKIGITQNTLTYPGSTLLDEINAFDLAEISGSNLGQLNIITVSSFCGPQGLIWGYDVCQPIAGYRAIGSVTRAEQRATLYDLSGLTMCFARLVGTREEQRFPIMPGSHVPAAMKMQTSRKPGVLYAALALGIPENRSQQACVMMENPGFCLDSNDWEVQRSMILDCLAQSVLAVGENQHVRYTKIFIGLVSAVVSPGQTGCAVALAPYFRLAQNAFVKERDLSALTIEEWEAETMGRFLVRQTEDRSSSHHFT